MTQETGFEILKIALTVFGAIGGYEIITTITKRIIKKVKKKTSVDIFDDYDRQLNTFIETHTETLNSLNEALDDVNDLKASLRERDLKLTILTQEVTELTKKLKEKDDLLSKLQTSQAESDKLLKKLKSIVEEFTCGNATSCINHNPIKI